MERKVVICRCPETKGLYGIRLDNMGELGWEMAWAFKITEKAAKSEGYMNETVDLSGPTAEYPGCPYCGTKSVVLCGNCGKLTCNTNTGHFKCEWCGTTGEVTIADRLKVTGGGF